MPGVGPPWRAAPRRPGSANPPRWMPYRSAGQVRGGRPGRPGWRVWAWSGASGSPHIENCGCLGRSRNASRRRPGTWPTRDAVTAVGCWLRICSCWPTGTSRSPGPTRSVPPGPAGHPEGGSVELRRALIDLGIGLWHSDAPARAYAAELRIRGNTAASSPERWRIARTGSRSDASPAPTDHAGRQPRALKSCQLRRPSMRRDLRPYRQSPGRR